MLNRFFVFSFCIFCLLASLSCNQKEVIHVTVAEDQSSHLKEIHQSLMKGRTMGLLAAEKMNLPFRILLNSGTDTMNLPEKTANAFRNGRDKTDLYLGVPSSECAHVAKYVSDAFQIPFITNASDDTLVENVTTVSLFNQTPLNFGKLIARYFYFYLKKNRVSIIYDEGTLSNKQMADGFNLESDLIGLVTSQNAFNGKSRKVDFNRILVTMKSWDPEIVFICADPNDYESILTVMKQVFPELPIVYLNRPPREESLLSNIVVFNQIFCFSIFFDQKKTFTESVFYSQFKTQFNHPPDFYAALGFDEIMLIIELVQRKKNQKRSDWFNECKGWKTENSKMYHTGFIGFNQDGVAMKPIDILSIQNGKLIFVNEYWTEVSLRR